MSINKKPRYGVRFNVLLIVITRRNLIIVMFYNSTFKDWNLLTLKLISEINDESITN